MSTDIRNKENRASSTSLSAQEHRNWNEQYKKDLGYSPKQPSPDFNTSPGKAPQASPQQAAAANPQPSKQTPSQTRKTRDVSENIHHDQVSHAQPRSKSQQETSYKAQQTLSSMSASDALEQRQSEDFPSGIRQSATPTHPDNSIPNNQDQAPRTSQIKVTSILNTPFPDTPIPDANKSTGQKSTRKNIWKSLTKSIHGLRNTKTHSRTALAESLRTEAEDIRPSVIESREAEREDTGNSLLTRALNLSKDLRARYLAARMIHLTELAPERFILPGGDAVVTENFIGAYGNRFTLRTTLKSDGTEVKFEFTVQKTLVAEPNKNFE